MKIAVVVGRKWHAPELAEALESLGHDVTVVTTEPFMFSGRQIRKVHARTLLRLSGRYPAIAPYTHWYFTSLARRHVAKLQPDTIIAWSSFGRELVTRGSRSILVRGSHHIETQASMVIGPGRPPRHRRKMIARELAEYDSFDAITVPTNAIATDPAWGNNCVIVAGYGFPSRSGSVIRPQSSSFSMLFVGELSHRKGVDRLSRISRSMPGIPMVVVGRQPSRQTADFPDHIDLRGQLAHADVLASMAAAGVLLLLSREEGQARVGLEAMSVGLPLLVTPETGLEMWCELGAGICLPGDSSDEEFAQAVRTLAEKRSAYSARAFELAQSWTWKDHATALLREPEASVDLP